MFLCSDHYVLLSIDSDDLLGPTVGIARVVEISSFAAEECGVYDVIIINPEHVAITDSFFFVSDFPLVSNFVSDDFSHVLDQNVIGLQIFKCEQSDSMDLGRSDFHFFGILNSISVLHRQRKVSLVHFLIYLGLVAQISQLLLKLVLTVLLSLLELVYLLHLIQSLEVTIWEKLLLLSPKFLWLIWVVYHILLHVLKPLLLIQFLGNVYLSALAKSYHHLIVGHVFGTHLVN